jgi:hypothetical protein
MTEYVDIETGEIITKEKFLKEYYKVNLTKKTEINGNYGTIKYTNECRSTRQTRCF